jgi:hypothetical protein
MSGQASLNHSIKFVAALVSLTAFHADQADSAACVGLDCVSRLLLPPRLLELRYSLGVHCCVNNNPSRLNWSRDLIFYIVSPIFIIWGFD